MAQATTKYIRMMRATKRTKQIVKPKQNNSTTIRYRSKNTKMEDYDPDDIIYLLFGIEPYTKFTAEELKHKYRRLAKKYHPDKHQDDDEVRKKYQEIMKAIVMAYELLKEDSARESYCTFGRAGVEFNNWDTLEMAWEELKRDNEKKTGKTTEEDDDEIIFVEEIKHNKSNMEKDQQHSDEADTHTDEKEQERQQYDQEEEHPHESKDTQHNENTDTTTEDIIITHKNRQGNLMFQVIYGGLNDIPVWINKHRAIKENTSEILAYIHKIKRTKKRMAQHLLKNHKDIRELYVKSRTY